MKKIITVIILAFAINTVAQVPEWQWAKQGGGLVDDWARCIAVDTSGNSYVAGYFKSPQITFGGFTIYNEDSTGYNTDMFITKYDATGNVIWVKAAGGCGDDYIHSITVDASGNSYITGRFNCPVITFGSFPLTHTAGPSNNLFVVKYDASGNVVWAKSAGGTSTSGSQDDVGNGISLDANGNCYITGYFYTPDITFGSYTLTNAGGIGNDMFIVKYDASGTEVWAKSAGGSSSYDIGNSISTDINGNSYVTGSFSCPIIVFGSTTLTNTGGNDVFIAKYDTNGNVVWAKNAGGSNDDSGRSIVIDDSGNSYVTGKFNSPTINWEGTILTNVAGYDFFIAKYDISGNMLWVKVAGGNDWDEPNGITVDASGNSYITGWFNSSSLMIGGTNLMAVSVDQALLFMAKYDANGNVLWAGSAGGGFYSAAVGNGIVADVNGNIYITGYFTADISSFGIFTFYNTNPGYMTQLSDMFIWRLCNNPIILPTITASGPITFCQGDSVTLTASAQNSYLWDNVLQSTTQSILVTTQSYLTVTETDANGCSARSLLTQVTVNSLPDTTITANGPTTFCQGDSVILSGTYGASSYSWSSGDTTMGATFLSSQVVSLTVNSSDGCSASSFPTTITANPLPTIPTITASGPTTFCYPDSVTLTSSLSDYYYWSSGWYTTQSITVLSSENNSVTVFDMNGCSSTSLPISIIVNYSAYSYQDTIACNSFTSPNGNIWTVSGLYTDTVPSAAGCDSIMYINLTINSSYYTTDYDSITNNFTLTVDSATLANAVSYHWDFGDGTTSTLVTPSHVYTVDTTYNVCMKIFTSTGDSCDYCRIIGKDYLGNIYRTTPGFTINVQISVDIPAILYQQSAISIYPNPFSTQTTVDLNTDYKNATLKIIDVLGKELKSINFSGKQVIFEREELNNGIYFIQIISEDKTISTNKIIIN